MALMLHDTSDNAPAQSPLLSPESAAAYLQVNPGTLANWRVQGCGPKYVRVGRRAFYRRSNLDEWIEARVYERTGAEPHREQMAGAAA